MTDATAADTAAANEEFEAARRTDSNDITPPGDTDVGEVVEGEIVNDADLVVAGPVTAALTKVDVWDIDAATKGLRSALIERVRLAAAAERAERAAALGPDTVPGESDIAPLVRRLDDAASVFSRIGDDFKEVAKAARQEIAEDAQSTGKARVSIPYGDASIVATPKVKRTVTWDDAGVASVIADLIVHEDTGEAAAKITDRVCDAAAVDDTDDERAGLVATAVREAYAAGLRAGAIAAVHKGRELSTKTEWKVTALDGLRKMLMRQERDAIAGVLERARNVKTETTDEWEVTRDTGARRS